MNRPNQTETITHLLNSRRVCNRPRFLIFNPYKAVNLPFHHSSHPGTARSQQVSEIDKLDDERDQDQTPEGPGRTTRPTQGTGWSERHRPSSQADPGQAPRHVPRETRNA